MPDINAGHYKTVRHGGVFTLTDAESATAYTLKGRRVGSFRMVPPSREVVVDKEEGALKTDARLLDEQPGSLTIEWYHTREEATPLHELIRDQVKGTNDGLARKWTVLWTSADFTGASGAGETFTFTNCVPDPSSFECGEGDQADTWRVTFICPTAPTRAVIS